MEVGGMVEIAGWVFVGYAVGVVSLFIGRDISYRGGIGLIPRQMHVAFTWFTPWLCALLSGLCAATCASYLPDDVLQRGLYCLGCNGTIALAIYLLCSPSLFVTLPSPPVIPPPVEERQDKYNDRNRRNKKRKGR